MSKKLLKAILSEDKNDETGKNILNSKVQERLSELRKEVAQKMFD